MTQGSQGRAGTARVLVVDDSVVVRRMVTRALEGAGDIEVCGSAPDGRIALDKLEQIPVDLMVLDLTMPAMDGMEVLRCLQAAHPATRAIVLSSHTQQGATRTLDVLAADYVTKPRAAGPDETVALLRDALVPRIRAICGLAAEPRLPLAACDRPPQGGVPRASVVALGASTGGPEALCRLLSALPPGLDAPLLVAQHLPAAFVRMFAGRLREALELPVCIVEAGAALRPGVVHVAPGSHDMSVYRDPGGRLRVRLYPASPERICKPSVDLLLGSAAEACGRDALGVVLTGMGRDGVAGARAIRRAGGAVLVQDEAGSTVWGMPGAVAACGLAEAVLPIDALAAEIVARIDRGAERAGAGMRA